MPVSLVKAPICPLARRNEEPLPVDVCCALREGNENGWGRIQTASMPMTLYFLTFNYRCFETVASPAYASATSAKMMPVEVVDVAVSNVAQNANLIATSAGDFGGYFYPVAGIGILAAFILYLSPPLADE
jgi:hypothetical protein